MEPIMLRKKCSLVAVLLLPLLLVWVASGVAHGQALPASAASAGVASSVPAPAPQSAPDINVPASRVNRFMPSHPVQSLGDTLASQWASTAAEIPREALVSPRYFRSIDTEHARLSLKQAIFVALSNNPNVKVAQLNPVGATAGVAAQNGIFDPDLTSTLDLIKTVIPATVGFETTHGTALSTKSYDWNFAINKILAQTNGTLSVTFNNDRTITNNSTETVNPAYTPTLAVSLSQPLLRNFGWKFATINVRLAESAQRQAQWNYAQSLTDFVQRVANDYWNVVLAEENLRVAEEALKFDDDLVRVNRVSVQVGTLAPIDLQEAQSAQETARANVESAKATLKSARATLREDVMLNPKGMFVPEDIDPSDRPNPLEQVHMTEQGALQLAAEYRPVLGGMREAIRTALIQTRFQENQTLPQVNAQLQFATTSMYGATLCGPTFGIITPNCTAPTGPGYQLPFKGGYGTALNQLFSFAYYNYAAVFTFERPLANAAARAALAQARVGLQQTREQYRAVLSQVAVEVMQSLANLRADVQRVKATKAATFYARQSLHDEQVRFKVGMATTHDLLQYESSLVSAEGAEVQAEIDLENAKIALRHATGTLLRAFQIEFELQGPGGTPWYADM